MIPGIRDIPPALERAGRTALGVGVAGLLACGAGLFLDPDQFFRSWLWAWTFWVGIAAGCVALLMLQHLTGGRWGLVLRRLMEAGGRTLPLLALLFVPLLFGLPRIYLWARPEAVAADALLQHKQPYLNVPFFVARTAFYLLLWSVLAWLLSRWSERQDATGDYRFARKMQALSGPGVALYVLSMTFASVDWLMSLEPHWFSTIYGALLIAEQVLGALSLLVAVAVLLSRSSPMKEALTVDRVHELAKLLFAFVMVWAYFSFSQFLIIWAGNLPEEIPWYLRRLESGWLWVALLLWILHFALPFILLINRKVKRNPPAVARIALLLAVMQIVEAHWTTAPAYENGVAFHWLDLAAPVGIGGIWIWAWFAQSRRRPLLPVGDPHLEEAFEHARR